MLESIEKHFDLTKKSPEQIGPLKLAFLGDAVYELIIRSILMDERDRSVKKMNRSADRLVNATTQAQIASVILPHLTEDEKAIFHRGRNAKNSSASKHSNIHDYRVATGLESLFGYWYLAGQTERAVTLLKSAIEELKPGGLS